ncbi:MAG TPA: hypothetical protein VKX16_08815, partial [Chloroflexota bacterium]|nr:hypothetical protein [Chloroflexota bacterium]
SGTNTICGSTIGKDLSVISTGTAAATVVGDTSGVCSAPNTIGRNGKFDRNSGSLDVSDNTFNRNLLVENNSSVPLIVTNNTIGNTCEQHGNPPGSVFSGNKAKRNLGC